MANTVKNTTAQKAFIVSIILYKKSQRGNQGVTWSMICLSLMQRLTNTAMKIRFEVIFVQNINDTLKCTMG